MGNTLSDYIPLRRRRPVDEETDAEFNTRSIGNKNKSVAILGHSGSGKTSLVRKLHGLQFRREHQHTETVEIYLSAIPTDHWRLIKLGLNFVEFIKYHLKKWVRRGRRSDIEREIPTVLRIWDFAGDVEFYATHRLFLSSNSVYVVVIDLSIGLDALADTKIKWTSKEFLNYWFNCIHSMSNNLQTEPRVIIVGTHRDLVATPVENKLEEVKAWVRQQPYRSLLYECFAIANNSENIYDTELIKEGILRAVHRLPDVLDRIPVKIFQLKDKLKETANRGKHALSKAHFRIACMAVFGRDSVWTGEEEIERLLQSLHDSGDVIYYRHLDMDKNIILNPQWLADKYRAIMGTEEGSRAIRQRLCDFKVNGFISDDTLAEVWGDDNDYLVQLSLLFGLFLRYDRARMVANELNLEGMGYICPIFLPVVEFDHEYFSLPPLVLQPASHFIPIGALTHVFSEYITQLNWYVSSPSAYRGFLKPPGCRSFGILLEVQHQVEGDCLKIKYKETAERLNQNLLLIKEQLVEVTSAILRENVKPGILCKRCKDFVPVLVPENAGFDRVQCEKCQCENRIAAVKEWFLPEADLGMPLVELMEDPGYVRNLIDQKTADLMRELGRLPLLFVASLLSKGAIDRITHDRLVDERDGHSQVSILMDFIRRDPVSRFKAFVQVLKDPVLVSEHVLEVLFI